MENKPNKEESPIYDTDYAPKPTYKSPKLGEKAIRRRPRSGHATWRSADRWAQPPVSGFRPLPSMDVLDGCGTVSYSDHARTDLGPLYKER